MPAFDFKEGSIADALDTYVSTRPFQWRFWKEADAVWIEPKALERRCADAYLKTKLNPIQMPLIGGSVDSPEYLLPLDALHQAWRESLDQPHNQVLILSAPSGMYGIVNPLRAVATLVLPGELAPKSCYEYLALWLGSRNHLIAGLARIPGNPEVKAGNRHPSIYLCLGSYDPSLSTLPTKDLVEIVLERPPDRMRHTPVTVFQSELYRRIMSDNEGTLKLMLGLKAVEKSLERKYGENLFWLVDAQPRLGAELFFSAFKQAPPSVRAAMLESNALPSPLDWGAEVLPYWEELSTSTDAKAKELADSILSEYKKKPKE